MLVGSTPIILCTGNFEKKYLMLIKILFYIHVLFACNCILLQRCCLFCYQITLTRSQISLFPFFTVTYSTVLYSLFHLAQLFKVFPFEHTNRPKHFMNMYTTSLTVNNYFETFPALSPQTALMRYHCPQKDIYSTV